MMIITNIIDIDQMLRLTDGQGPSVRPCVRRSVIPHRVFFAYKSWTDGWILMTITYIIDINETVKLTQGQGHKVKGQGHICINEKFLFRL